MRIQVAAVLILGLVAGAGCSHTTTVSAKPAGTKIYVEDKEIGVDQGAASVPNGMGGSFTVRAEKEGYPPLEAKVSRDELSMGALGGGIGGCLGGGCVGAGIGTVLAAAGGGTLFFLIPCCGVVMGGPFLAFLLWMNQAPDIIAMDLDARTVTSTPSVKIAISGAEDAPAVKPQPPTPGDVKPEDAPDTTPPPGDDGVQPFDY